MFKRLSDMIKNFLKPNINVEGFNMPVALISIIWAFGGLYLLNKFKFKGYIPGMTYYLVSILLCCLNWRTLKSFLVNPVKTSSNKRKFEILLLYPFIAFILGIGIRILMSALNIVSDDPQKLSEIHIYSLSALFSRLIFMLPAIFSEELFNLLVLLFTFKALQKNGRLQIPISIILVLASFGLSHLLWNTETALTMSLAYVPSIVLMIYFKNIWPPIMAHLIQNTIGITGLYNTWVMICIFITILIVVGVYFNKKGAVRP